MAKASIEKRVDRLEEALTELAQQSRVTEIKLATFIQEMRDYREENDRMIQEMKEENNRMIQEMKEDTRLLGERLDKTIQEMKEDTRIFKERTDKTIQEMKEENNRMMREMKEDTRLLGERLDKTIQEMKEDTRIFKEGVNVYQDRLDKTVQEMKEDTRLLGERLDKTIQEMKEDTRLFKEGTDRTIQDMKESTKTFEENMNKTIQDMNRRWGELANKMGTVTEDIVAPGFPFLIERYFGLSLDDISCRRKVKDKSGNRWEFDLVARSGNIAFIVDVKSDYNRVEYLDHFAQVVLPKAAELLPDLKGSKIIGCIASFRLAPSIIERASQMGILAISLGGDYLEFCNQEVVESIRETIGG